MGINRLVPTRIVKQMCVGACICVCMAGHLQESTWAQKTLMSSRSLGLSLRSHEGPHCRHASRRRLGHRAKGAGLMTCPVAGRRFHGGIWYGIGMVVFST